MAGILDLLKNVATTIATANNSQNNTPVSGAAAPAANTGAGYTVNGVYIPPITNSGAYKATGTYFDAGQSQQGVAYLNDLKQQYDANATAQAAAKAAGNTAEYNRLLNLNNQLHAQAEEMRAATGQYSGGVDGSEYNQYLQSILPAPTSTGSGNIATHPREDANVYANQGIVNGYASNPYQYASYTDPLATAIAKNSMDVIDYDPFSYDYRTDPLYQQYYMSGMREGNIAADEAAARAAARTGGLGNSFSDAAASQQRSYYNAQIADKIPELEQLAYQKYLDKYGMERNDVDLLTGLSNTDYARYADGRNFDYGVYDDRQGYAMDALTQARGIDNDYYGRTAADREYQLMLQQLAQEQANYSDETQYSRGVDAYNQALQRSQLTGYVSASDAAILGVPAGTSYATAKSSGGGTSGSGSSGSAARTPETLFSDIDASGMTPTMFINSYGKEYGYTTDAQRKAIVEEYEDYISGDGTSFSEILNTVYSGAGNQYPDAVSFFRNANGSPDFDKILAALESARSSGRITANQYALIERELKQAGM
jgi:hypothetical protein